MSKALFACSSSSGKYFKCLGTLCGHCGSAHDAGAHSSKSMVGGSDRRVEKCMMMSGNARAERYRYAKGEMQ
jgi:hypothetical protein